MRPFLRSAKVIPRGCSRALQRAITDFAADQPFAQVRTKLQEHYGFAIGESTIQRIALGHAKNIFEASRVIPVFLKRQASTRISSLKRMAAWSPL